MSVPLQSVLLLFMSIPLLFCLTVWTFLWLLATICMFLHIVVGVVMCIQLLKCMSFHTILIMYVLLACKLSMLFPGPINVNSVRPIHYCYCVLLISFVKYFFVKYLDCVMKLYQLKHVNLFQAQMFYMDKKQPAVCRYFTVATAIYCYDNCPFRYK